MLTYLALGILLLGVVLFAGRLFSTAKPKDLIRALMWLGLTLAMVGVMWLVLSGKLWVALAALPAVLVWFMRLVSGVRAFAMLRGLLGGLGGRTANAQSRPDAAMSRDEAHQVLGLRPGASEIEIHAAHRRLIADLHPDKGGTDYLAAKINRAKDVLLGD